MERTSEAKPAPGYRLLACLSCQQTSLPPSLPPSPLLTTLNLTQTPQSTPQSPLHTNSFPYYLQVSSVITVIWTHSSIILQKVFLCIPLCHLFGSRKDGGEG